MRKMLTLLILISLVACGRGKKGADGRDSIQQGILDESSIGVDLEDILPGLACANGGVSIFTFKDLESNGVLDSDDSIIKVKSICHGLNGTDGTNGTSSSMTVESVASSSTCPNGGVKITSSSSSVPVEICNGANGLNGEQGIQGAQGIPGMAGATGAAGADGTVVTPVKFCPTDNSTHPEYGLLIGEELFAVYWGSTPASPSVSQAFLTKLMAGNYMSTGGNNCLFSVQ